MIRMAFRRLVPGCPVRRPGSGSRSDGVGTNWRGTRQGPRRAGGARRRRQDHDFGKVGEERTRGQDEQERRVRPGGPLPRRLHDHRGEGAAEGHARCEGQHRRQPAARVPAGARLRRKRRDGGKGRRAAEVVRGRRRVQQGRQVRRVDRQVQRGARAAARVRRLLLQHRLREHAEEGLRRRPRRRTRRRSS